MPKAKRGRAKSGANKKVAKVAPAKKGGRPPKVAPLKKKVAKPVKAKAAAPTTPAKRQPTQATDDLTASEQKRRQLERRDSNDAASRALELKFPFISVERMSALRNKRGQTPEEVVAAQIHDNRKAQKHLDTWFWTEFTAMFGLNPGETYGALPAPTEEEFISPAFAEACMKPTSSNPADRSVDDLRALLEYEDDPNYTLFYGLMQSCVPHFNLSETNRMELEYLSLQFVAQRRLIRNKILTYSY